MTIINFFKKNWTGAVIGATSILLLMYTSIGEIIPKTIQTLHIDMLVFLNNFICHTIGIVTGCSVNTQEYLIYYILPVITASIIGAFIQDKIVR